MKRCLQQFTALLFVLVTVVACSAPFKSGDPESSSVDQVETAVAMTLQALAPENRSAPTSKAQPPANLLPHRLYFLGNDNQSISQIYRLERDGATRTQLTREPIHVSDYDVSPADGRIAYVASNQLLLMNADGSNRQVLIDGGSGADLQGFYHPVFSPDGRTLAYAREGLNLYDLSTGVSTLVIPDQMDDLGDGHVIARETFSPESYAPDGTKLLVALGHWEVMPSHAVYYPATGRLVRHTEVTDYIYCCSFHGGPVWAPDSSAFYGVASVHDSAYQFGELWKVDATNGTITRTLAPRDQTFFLPRELFLAPDGQLYFFLGSYHNASGYFDAPVLELVRSAPDGVTGRIVLRDDNFVLMNEALWAPDASFVIVSSSPGRAWDTAAGVLELYFVAGDQDPIWLAPSGQQLKWGP